MDSAQTCLGLHVNITSVGRRKCLQYTYKTESVGMAAASTHVDTATRAYALETIFRDLEDDSDNLATQLEEELRGDKYLSSTDPRVKPWIDLLRAGLLASRRWVAAYQQPNVD